MRRVLAVATCALVFGCGGGGDDSGEDGRSRQPTETTASTSPVTGGTTTGMEGGEITDARVVAEFLVNTAVAWGEQGSDLDAMAEGIAGTYPDLTLSGSVVPADPTTVSSAATLADDKDSPSAENPQIVAFAVRDTGDQCIGVAAVGHPAPTEILHFAGESGDECTAQEMVDAARVQVGSG